MAESFSEPVVVTAMREFKQGLLARESSQMTAMARRWLTVERALSADIELLARQMEEEREAGKSVSQSKVYRMARYQSLKAQAEGQFRQYADYADRTITNAQGEMVGLGIDHAVRSTQLSYFPAVGAYFDRLPLEAVQHMVGIAGDGKPVGDLLRQRMLKEERAPAGWHRLTDMLVQGTAKGWNPRKTARKMRDALTGGLQKALVIARSEQIRVYKQASVDQYVASGVVLGQKRLVARSGQPCVACLADDGTIYNLNQIIPDHPNGRCTGVPIVRGMPDPTWPTGKEWFDQQPESVQRSIMKGERWEAYKAGKIQFADMGAYTFDPTWGGGVTPVSVRDLLAGVKPKAVPADLRRLRPVVVEPDWLHRHPALKPLHEIMTVAGEHGLIEERLSALEKLPERVMQQLQEAGIEIAIGRGTVPDIPGMERLRGKRPRGWPSGTWDDVEACYDAANKRVILGTAPRLFEDYYLAYRPSRERMLITLHEVGHAIDVVESPTDPWSQRAEFDAIHKRRYAFLARYYQQGGRGGRVGKEELFAQGFAEALYDESRGRRELGNAVIDYVLRAIR